MPMVVKRFQRGPHKITVEDLDGFRYIATLWNKEMCYEPDREVYEFETFGGAMNKAFDLLTEIL